MWQFDDSNHTKHPIITMNLKTGQRDYNFTTDQQGNLVLDIYRVLAADSSGVFKDLTPRDQQTPNNQNSDTTGFVDGQNLTGTPTEYDKTGQGIFLNLIPNYDYTDGLKVLINREGSYFVITDTTKKPGIAGLLHEIYVVAPAYKYAARKGLKSKNDLLRRKLELEAGIDEHYGFRAKDVKKRMTPYIADTK